MLDGAWKGCRWNTNGMVTACGRDTHRIVNRAACRWDVDDYPAVVITSGFSDLWWELWGYITNAYEGHMELRIRQATVS